MFDPVEVADALRGIPPTARRCASQRELGEWFALLSLSIRMQRVFSVTLRGTIETVSTTVRVRIGPSPLEERARAGRTLPAVRR